MRRWNIEKVRKYVKENSDCEVVSNEYKNTLTPLEFICGCGEEFTTNWKQFTSEQAKKRQCNACGRKNSNKNRTYTLKEINEYVNRYGTELLSKEYKNCKTPLKFKCSCGNNFETPFDYVKNGNRKKCFECISPEGNLFLEGSETHNKKTHEEFLKELYQLRKNEYEVIGEYKNAHEHLTFKHECGFRWQTTPDKVLNANQECPECYSNHNSKLSRKIQEWLDNHKLFYKKEYRFPDCRYIKPLPFDFAVFTGDSLMILIEADGEQHYKPFRFTGREEENLKNFELIQKRDKIKNEYCENNNIKLLRIPYFELKNVEKILKNSMLIPSQDSERESIRL